MNIRFEVLSARGAATVYDASCVLGADPSDQEVEAAVRELVERLEAELKARNDEATQRTSFRWYVGKAWTLHLYVAGRVPALKE